ncbi:hypothetical protein CMV_001844 [Castanea mollissima]|uniref:Uncharacterized protein n=1 Tax=Castanea mollissima TaxID=60419 RepID=A0A8J4W438_9ROSI|nr:hypothetical protein CMV_001844 [Castanea mollissima]
MGSGRRIRSLPPGGRKLRTAVVIVRRDESKMGEIREKERQIEEEEEEEEALLDENPRTHKNHYQHSSWVLKVPEEGMGSLESEQHSQRRSSMACGSTKTHKNFRLHVEAHQAEDGCLLLGIYTLEAEEEIRDVGFMNHQSTGNL